MTLPHTLAFRLEEILGDEYREYVESLASSPRPCLRVNTIKATLGEVKEVVAEAGLDLESVPWCPTGFWIDRKEHKLGDSVAHFQGLFYLEDAASLLPPEMLAPGKVVLDAAAAPGGKTAHIAALMGNRGALVANEVDAYRTRVLRFNLSRMGVINAAVTTLDMSVAPNVAPIFDRVLLDAPCSCEGRIAEDPKSLALWKPARVERYSRLQRRLIESCYCLLAPGGSLVYSTCTLAPEENEAVIDSLLKNHTDADIKPIKRPAKSAKGLVEWRGEKYDERVARSLRLYPHHYGTHGFFVSRVVKCL